VQLNCNYKRTEKLALEVHRITDDTSSRAITFVTSWHTRARHLPLHNAKAWEKSLSLHHGIQEPGHSPLHHAKAQAYTRLLSSLYFHNISSIQKK